MLEAIYFLDYSFESFAASVINYSCTKIPIISNSRFTFPIHNHDSQPLFIL